MANELFTSMHISSAGMAAQWARMDVVSENIANSESTKTADGGPYRRTQVVFEAVGVKSDFNSVFRGQLNRTGAQTVRVAEISKDMSPFNQIYDPTHPDADQAGMVNMPNVNTIEEMVDMNSAARSFEANITTMDASKRMFLKALELLR
ncbi:MAG TPA: flagellar basal body rod protein FlgC [Ghiorsea sp.]|nr:flagellar basal body rod protein FlgC [Ghiorsea sp.]HIP06686.1 flagellar basal body rod protein FlgC [Mariprofundaceae bacterium]